MATCDLKYTSDAFKDFLSRLEGVANEYCLIKPTLQTIAENNSAATTTTDANGNIVSVAINGLTITLDSEDKTGTTFLLSGQATALTNIWLYKGPAAITPPTGESRAYLKGIDKTNTNSSFQLFFCDFSDAANNSIAGRVSCSAGGNFGTGIGITRNLGLRLDVPKNINFDAEENNLLRKVVPSVGIVAQSSLLDNIYVLLDRVSTLENRVSVLENA